jgi:hypothetical protein
MRLASCSKGLAIKYRVFALHWCINKALKVNGAYTGEVDI